MTEKAREGVAPSDRVAEARISVIGVGGAGGNAVNNMISADLEGVDFVVANTDAQALGQSLCEAQIQLGTGITKGLGAGANPEIGKAAAEEAIDAISHALEGANMAFITAGMGGGTGTGGAPVIAQAAREKGVLTVGVVTKPFEFEGAHRMRQAEAGIAELAEHVDTLIVIPNQNLFRVADETTTFADAFKMADEVLHSGVRGVTDLIVLPGLVNLDFADVRETMVGMGKAVMGTGEAEGENRALAAAEAAISNPLLDDVSMKGARSVLINITGGMDLTLREVDQAANRIREEVDPEASIIFGSAFSEELTGKIRVSVIATGNPIDQGEQLIPSSERLIIGRPKKFTDRKSAAPAGAVASAEPAVALDESVHESTRAEVQPSEGRGGEEPLTLRLVSNLRESDQDAETAALDVPSPDAAEAPEISKSVAESAAAEPTSEATIGASTTASSDAVVDVAVPDGAGDVVEESTAQAVTAEASGAAAQTSTEPSSKEALTLHLQGSLPVTLDVDQSAESEKGASSPEAPPEPSEDALPQETGAEPFKSGARRRSLPKPKWTQKPIFNRPATPAKSESTLEAFENTRDSEEPTESGPEKTHYLVWETNLGARLYKIPEAKISLLREQRHADSMKLFDSVENAKSEVNAIFKRVAAERTAKGFPKSVLASTLDDILRCEEENIPSYFL